MHSCLRFSILFLLVALLFHSSSLAVQAADTLSAVIETNDGQTIDVTSIAPTGWIEYTPQGGKKTKVLFKDIEQITWNKSTREHTVTQRDGTTLKVQRAWIFTGSSGAYLQFTGKNRKTGEDAGGSISGSDIAVIKFTAPAPATTETQKVSEPQANKAQTQPETTPTDTAKPETTPVTPEPTPAAEPAQSPTTSEPVADPAPAPTSTEPPKPTRPAKRLPTSNLEYARDAAKDLKEKLPNLLELVAKAKADGSFTKDDDEEGLVGLTLYKKIHKLFENLPRYYYLAMQDGWEVSDPEFAPLKEQFQKLAKLAAQADYWTCASPDEFPESVTERQFEYWDRMRMKAYAAMIWTNQRKDLQKGREMMEQVVQELEKMEKHFTESKTKLHPAFLRLKAEVARLQKECESGFKTAGDEKQKALAAWKALHDETERLQEFIGKIEMNQFHPNMFPEFIQEIEKFEKTDSAVIREKLEYLGKNYGTTPEALDASMQKLAGGDKPEGVVNDLSYLVKRFEEIFAAVPRVRREIAESVVAQTNQMITAMESFSEDIRAKKYEELKNDVELGLRYDSHNADLINLKAKIEEQAAKSSADIQKQIEERQWPGHHKGFSGPGNPDDLAKAALEYFNSTCKPGEKALAACVIEPEWYCFKRNIFGQPIQWALTFQVAVDVEGETTPDLIYTWSISFLTEENVGVEKKPPFKSAAFNFKQKMKRANVPGLK